MAPDARTVRQKRSRIGAAVRVARFASVSALTTAAWAVVVVLLGFFDHAALLLAACMALTASFERRFAPRLLRQDPVAARALAVNQGVLFAAILAYCAWGWLLAEHAGLISARASNALASMGWAPSTARAAAYSTAILTAAAIEGFSAAYYMVWARRFGAMTRSALLLPKMLVGGADRHERRTAA